MPKSQPTTIHTLETFLLQLLVFLIPSNLAYHLYSTSAYINGRLVDYLIPKIYLSDIPLILLLLIFILKSIKKSHVKLNLISINVVFIFYLLIRSTLSLNPLSSIWYVTKLISFVCLGKYLVNNYTSARFTAAIKWPLLLSLLTQSIISIYQYINQMSLFGYYLLGEPDLLNPNISKLSISGTITTLPYGTTPHPNVLAGFMVVGLLLLNNSTQLNLKKWFNQAVNISITGLSVSVIWLTRSISALSGLIFSQFIYLLNLIISIKYKCLLFQIILCITLVISLLIYPILNHSKILTDNPSFYERYEINKSAINIIGQHFLSGVGPNLFIQYLPTSPISRQQSYLLQPSHHGFILIWAETGLVGIILLSANLVNWVKSARASKPPITAFLPIAALYIILLLDHYPLTLQTGQLLLTFSLSLPLLKSQT